MGRATWGMVVFAEVKLNGAGAALLVYAAYFILRGHLMMKKRKHDFRRCIQFFAFVMFMVLINVIPRISNSSLHLGNGGNPVFNSYDLDMICGLCFIPP